MNRLRKPQRAPREALAVRRRDVAVAHDHARQLAALDSDFAERRAAFDGHRALPLSVEHDPRKVRRAR